MNNTPTEYQECLTLVDFMSLLKNSGKILAFSHVPQETYTTSWAVKNKNKSMGVRKGVPDYLVVTNKAVLFIEMKRVKGGKLGDEQRVWLEALAGKPTHATMARGADEAMEFIKEYL